MCMHVQVGDWDHASALMSRLAATGLQPASWPPLCDTLCGVVTRELEGVLAVLAPQVGVRFAFGVKAVGCAMSNFWLRLVL